MTFIFFNNIDFIDGTGNPAPACKGRRCKKVSMLYNLLPFLLMLWEMKVECLYLESLTAKSSVYINQPKVLHSKDCPQVVYANRRLSCKSGQGTNTLDNFPKVSDK